jgi:hypothetical protein
MVETNTTNYISARVLSQYEYNGILHPVTYVSRKYSVVECNYQMYDKELIAIIHAFED